MALGEKKNPPPPPKRKEKKAFRKQDRTLSFKSHLIAENYVLGQIGASKFYVVLRLHCAVCWNIAGKHTCSLYFNVCTFVLKRFR